MKSLRRDKRRNKRTRNKRTRMHRNRSKKYMYRIKGG
jgi:hypothetical protein